MKRRGFFGWLAGAAAALVGLRSARGRSRPGYVLRNAAANVGGTRMLPGRLDVRLRPGLHLCDVDCCMTCSHWANQPWGAVIYHREGADELQMNLFGYCDREPPPPEPPAQEPGSLAVFSPGPQPTTIAFHYCLHYDRAKDR